MEIKCEPVFLCCMDDKVPTVLLFEGRRYLLEKKESEEKEIPIMDKTDDLKQLVIERSNGEQPPKLGKVIARVGSTLVHENPLNEMLILKEKNKLTALNMAKVLHKYHPGLKATTIVVYRSGYQNFINKSKKMEIRMNDRNVIYETVTDKNKETVRGAIIALGDGASFDELLKDVDMTDYKLKLILNDPSMSIEKYGDPKREKYRLME